MKNLRKFSHEMVSQFKSNKVTVAAGSLVAASASQAAVTAPDFTTNIADLGIILGSMIAFGAVVWGARRLLGFTA